VFPERAERLTVRPAHHDPAQPAQSVLIQRNAHALAPGRSLREQLARWTAAIPAEFRGQAEQIVVAAARAGAGLRELAAICAEIRRLDYCIMTWAPPGLLVAKVADRTERC
jgi:hypothetical protein